MEFILNLLLLNGRVLTRAAVSTVHEALQKCMRLQQKIRVEYNQASSMAGPFGNMLELIHYHVGELENEAANYLVSGEMKCKVYDHFNGTEPVLCKSTTPKEPKYKPISEPSTLESSFLSGHERPRSDDNRTPAMKRKRKLNEESKKKIKEEEFLVENLSAILKSQEFLFKNICKLVTFFENSRLNINPAKLEKIKQKLFVCKQVLSSSKLPQGLDDKAIDEIIEGEILRCRLATAEISKIPNTVPKELSKDSKVVIFTSNPNPMPIKAPKSDRLPMKKKKEDLGMYIIEEKSHSYPLNEIRDPTEIGSCQCQVTQVNNKQDNFEPMDNVTITEAQPLTEIKTTKSQPIIEIKTAKAQPIIEIKTTKAQPVIQIKTTKTQPVVEIKATKAQPSIEMKTTKEETWKTTKEETWKPTSFYNQPQFSGPPTFPEFQQSRHESSSGDKFKIIARVLRDGRKRNRRGNSTPFRMTAEDFFKSQRISYNSELVPVYLNESFKPSVFKFKKLSKESQLESNNNLMQVLEKNEEHFRKFEGCLAQSLIDQKFMSMKGDVLNMCKCNYYNKRHFNKAEATIVKKVEREEIREHFGKISSKNLSHFNRIEARIAQNLAMDHLEETKENLGRSVLTNEKHFNLVDKQISQNIARSREAEVLDRNKEMFTIMDRKLQADASKNQLEQLMAINEKQFVKAETEIEKKIIQSENDSLKLLPRSIEIERKKNEDELLLKMNVNEFDKFEDKVRTIVVDELKNHLRCHPLLSQYEQESLLEKNIQAFNDLEETLKTVPILRVSEGSSIAASLESKKSRSSLALSKPTANQTETTSKFRTTETIEQQICYESYFKQKEVEIATINKVSSSFVSMVVNKTFIKTQSRINLTSSEQISRILESKGYTQVPHTSEKKKTMITLRNILDDTEDSGSLNEIKHSSSKPKLAQGLEKSKTFLKEDYSSSKEKKTMDMLESIKTLPIEDFKKQKAVSVLEELPKITHRKKIEDYLKMTIPKKTGLIPNKDNDNSPQQSSVLKDEIDKTSNEAKVTCTKAIRTMHRKKEKDEEKDEDEELVKKPLPQLRRTTKAEMRRKQIQTIIPKIEHVKTPRHAEHVINIKKVGESTVKLNIEPSLRPKHIARGYCYKLKKNPEKVVTIDAMCASMPIKKVVTAIEGES